MQLIIKTFSKLFINFIEIANQDKVDACLYKGAGNTKTVPYTY